MNKEINWYEEVKQDFTKNISDSYTLNLAMSILEDRNNLLNDNLDLQNNWNELMEDIPHILEIIEHNKDVIKVTSDEELAIYSLQNKMQELDGINGQKSKNVK